MGLQYEHVLYKVLSKSGSPRLGAFALSPAEQFTAVGSFYRLEIDVPSLPAAGVQWFTITAPADKDLYVANREVMASFAGAELNVYIGASGFTPTGDPIIPDRLNPTAGTASGATATLITAPSTPGAKRTVVFEGPGGGSGPARTAGSSSSAAGFNVQARGSTAVYRLVNNAASAARMVVHIDFAELAEI